MSDMKEVITINPGGTMQTFRSPYELGKNNVHLDPESLIEIWGNWAPFDYKRALGFKYVHPSEWKKSPKQLPWLTERKKHKKNVEESNYTN